LTDQIVTAPDPDTVLKESDTLLVAGKDEDLARAARQD
jgi:K+/H+ antiporter YhaU regulatory subunit KhtT